MNIMNIQNLSLALLTTIAVAIGAPEADAADSNVMDNLPNRAVQELMKNPVQSNQRAKYILLNQYKAHRNKAIKPMLTKEVIHETLLDATQRQVEAQFKVIEKFCNDKSHTLQQCVGQIEMHQNEERAVIRTMLILTDVLNTPKGNR
jgi:hypothetical protein